MGNSTMKTLFNRSEPNSTLLVCWQSTYSGSLAIVTSAVVPQPHNAPRPLDNAAWNCTVQQELADPISPR
jgi:hypothetical protein